MSLNVPGMDFMKNQWSDIMVQHSVYAGVVFLICAHPEVCKFVDKNLTNLVRQVDKSFRLDGNLLLSVMKNEKRTLVLSILWVRRLLSY